MPTLLPLWRKARRVSSAASRLPGTTSLRFALHGWQRQPVFDNLLKREFSVAQPDHVYAADVTYGAPNLRRYH
ncbi:MAG: hypothetical protein JMN24_18655 [gamma proteobacterium endosymbiont of Lamellibrachia anaximandri]|nr:hypothetical protein [gamma proteobacterium endosymbiont of Lamellibrachia anaximandri]